MMRIASLLFFMTFLSSCSGEQFEHKSEFEKSTQKWNAFKQESKNSYKYTVVGGSWTGVSWSTNVVVKDGQVIERSFRYLSFRDYKRPDEGWTEEIVQSMLDKHQGNQNAKEFLATLEWTERDIELGINNNSPAAAVYTIDQIYDKAKSEWLAKQEEGATYYFETKNNGIISLCGFVPNNCMDDCFIGINISSVEKYY